MTRAVPPISFPAPPPSPSVVPATLAFIRRALFAILAFGLIGTEVDLLLLEHFEDWTQYLPLVLLGVALLVQLWYVAARSRTSIRASVRTLQALMWLFVASGLVGIVLHYRGNMEFEREMSPAIAGLELFKAAMMGATPALAPGQMVQLGLIGLAWAFRHPALSDGHANTES